MITKTEAVVLRSMKYRDSSKIVTFYSRRFGKLKGIAKAARQMNSKFGAALEPITEVSLVLYKKEHRELQLISQCDIQKSYKNIHAELERMAVGLAILEIIDQLSHEEEGNDALYLLLTETLDELELAPGHFMNFFLAFELRYASLVGFMPHLDSCQGCGRAIDDMTPEGSALLQTSRGSVLCERCRSGERATAHRFLEGSPPLRGSDHLVSEAGNIRISIGALQGLRFLLKAPLASLGSFDLGSAVGNEADGTLCLYMRQHFDEFKTLRSFEILRKFPVADPDNGGDDSPSGGMRNA